MSVSRKTPTRSVPFGLSLSKPLPGRGLPCDKLGAGGFVRRFRQFLALAWSLVAAAPVLALPQLECQLTLNGRTQILRTGPVSDPYTVAGIDVLDAGHFRFKAVLVGEAGRIDYVKLYTYHLAGRQPVLVHQASYLAPRPLAVDAGPDALTGQQRIYSPKLERELSYGCKLLEAAP